ncbi:Probable LRR receptor-like serine/threonine-protein kinase At3g47570 [Linum grandiflorum]
MGSGNLSVNVVVGAALVQLLCFCCCYGSNETDRLALLSFKSMISSDPLGALSSWNDSTHFCRWYGVSCSKRHYGQVIALLLQNQELYGYISPHIGNLSFLKVLNLSGNMLVGEIPHEIGSLRRLKQLVLYNNSLGGEISPNISGCSALIIFSVAENKLVGGLPWQLGQLNKLRGFDASYNNLSGSIPASFGNLSSLQLFGASNNQMSGRLPDALGQLKSLQYLFLSQNNLCGEIPASIFNISSLVEMWFGDNQLNGSLPWNLGISLPNLEVFDVANNSFTGSLPPSLSNASNLVLLQLNINNFTGRVPTMKSSNKLRNYVICYNSLGSGKAGDLDFLSSLTNATGLEFLHIGVNNFGGNLPKHIANLSTSLKYLGFNENQISGNIPSDIQHLVNLEVLGVYTNLLSGTIPPTIGNLHSLKRLYLDNNYLSGYIPSSIGNLTQLIQVNMSSNHLQGELPASIGNCQQLLFLEFGSNNLSGAIPPQLLSVASLSTYLGLGNNKFCGSIPAQVGSLKNLGSIDLSHNMLSGSIPTSLGSCASLEFLQLQGNLLQGTIPELLSSLKGLRVLDLSSNNLTGQIPNYLVHMDISLSLNLSYNNFEGEVPDQGVFRNTSIVSVIGNDKLCGGMDELKFPPCYFNKHTFNYKWKVVVSTISGLGFLALVTSCLFIFWKRGKQVSVSANALQLPLPYQRLYKATNGFSSTNLIGAGSFGSVYKGVLNENGTNTNIAVKVFNLERHGGFKSFMAECDALKNIRHRNLVRIITVCSSVDHEGKDFKALVYEFLANGSLEEWLHRSAERIEEPVRRLNFIQRVNLAIDIACGVDYLHNNCGTPIVHCDLKPSNILLDEDMVAHIGDFGLARILSEHADPSSSSIFIKGTVGYAAPAALVQLLCFCCCYGSNETDRLALLSFKSMITNDPSGALSSWNDSVPFCRWYGVSCSKRHLSKVSALLLPDQELAGSISPHIGNLSFLKVLNLSHNMFVGGIPHEIGRLRRLQKLVLRNNSLGGEIPPNISRCSDLTIFWVGRNKLVGGLPWQLGQLNKLRRFSASLNNLSGSIPASFGNLSSLQLFATSYNQMSGRFPDALGQLKSLQHLALGQNNLSGEISASIFNISSLVEMWFGNNQFNGSLPRNLGISLPNLEVFDVANNSFTGSLPPSLSNASNLVILQTAINNFTGSVPSMKSSNKLLYYRIFENSLGSGKAGDLGYLSSLTNATSLEFLEISSNNFGGSIEKHIANLPTSLKLLDISENKISGNIPSDIQHLVNLEGLGVYTNLLSGQIPNFLEHMDISQSLNLSYNKFEGEVPDQGVFRNTSIVSVIGNNKLCGGMDELKFPPCSFPKHTFNHKWKVVVSTISGLGFLALVTSCLFIFWKRRKQVSVSANSLQLPLPYQRLYKATDGFSSTNLIGVGSFGSVYKGVLNENGIETNIAVKVFNLERHGGFKSFMAECDALKNIRHRNLARIITVCSSVDHDGKDFKALIYEFFANGCLEEWLHHSPQSIEEPTRSLNFIQRVNLAIDIACGVDYLHNNCGTPIVHCDLKPSNILLDEDMVAHIGDFGLARILSEHADPSSSSIFIKGTVGYAAPEYGMGNEVSSQGDIYSYGIVLLEMFTGKRPVDENFEEGLNLHNIVQRALSNQQTMEVMDPILLNELLSTPTTHRSRPSRSREETNKCLQELLTSIIEIGIACSSDNPEERLTSNETDRMALLHFKSMISNDPFGALNSWNDSTHLCQWYGVSCSERHDGRVTNLSLPSQGLYGSISPHIGNLSFLKGLLLYNNSFVYEIPLEIGRLRRLQNLELHNNTLSGEIPSNISQCSELVNHFSGTIPDSLGRLKNLTALYLNVNDFHGEIPASIFNLSSLTDLWFGGNYKLHGELPPNLGILLPNLVNFDVGGNRFTGRVPPTISNISNLFMLQMSENNFTGNMPNLAACNKLARLLVQSNSLGTGKAPDLDFLASLVNASSLEVVHIEKNNFGGSLPENIGNLSTDLLQLTVNDNKISGNFPNGIQSLVNLEVLWADNNYLSGTIQPSFGNLRFLRRCNLFNNDISGNIPMSIGNLAELIELDISANRLQGEIPASIGNLKNLLLFNLSHNDLHGVIPLQVMGLSSLSRTLDLSYNRFTGSIPVEVGNLRNLGSLNLSHNMLSGSIPSSLGSCVMLESLHLEGNLLDGSIPSSLSSIRGIEELDLSANNLSGQIPRFLERMNISKFLNLSYNNFDGEMPGEGVFRNASIVSVVGNSKLCGGMTEFELPPCKNLVNKTLNRKWKIVISTMSGLLFVAFVGFCFFVFRIKKRGRQGVVSVDDQQLQQLSYQRLYKATDGFSSANRIGIGSFGSVYKGVLDENNLTTNIAVKVFNLQRRGASKSFVAECEALRNVRHINLVKILTVCSSVDHEGNDFKALIYEFMANGSLEDWLHRPAQRTEEPTKSLNFLQRINLVIDIASAIDYLHNNCGTPIVHCDIKPSNILLDEDMVAHVGDFGLARFLSAVVNPSLSSVGIKGTVGYAPPEYGMGNEVSIQGDVYSFGVLLLEMFTGRRPVDEIFTEGSNLHNNVRSVLSNQQPMEVVDPFLRNELLSRLTTLRNHTSGSSLEETRNGLEELMSSILEIGVTCSASIPEERVSMTEVLSKLTAVKKKVGQLNPTGRG